MAEPLKRLASNAEVRSEMLLHTRSIAFTAAVIGLFAVSAIGAIEGLSPDVCTERALLGALITYVAASFVVRAIDAIITQAMIASELDKDDRVDNEN